MLCASALALVSTTARGDARTEARRHFRAGMALIETGEYDAGIAELEKADAILPHPNVTYNIARAHEQAGRLEEAVAAYERYLESDPADRGKVAESVRALRERIAAARQPEPEPESAAAAIERAEERRRQAHAAPPAREPAPTPTAPPPSGSGEVRTEDVYEEKVVTASRGAQSPLDAPNSTTILTRQDIRLSGITRIPELLRRVAGMDVMQITGGDASVSMRGFNSRLSNKLLVFVDGRSVRNDILGSTFWESLTIDVDQIERIEIVRGPGSALYGADAFTGVVNIITVRPGEGRGGLRVGYGEQNEAYGSIWTTGRDGDFAYRAAAGYTRRSRWTREVSDERLDVETANVSQDLGARNARIDVRTSHRVGLDSEIEIGGGFARSDIDLYGIGPFNDYVAQIDNSDVSLAFRGKHLQARTYFSRIAARASANSGYVGHTRYPTSPEQNVLDAEIDLTDGFALPSALEHDVVFGVGYRLKNIEWSYLAEDTPIEHHGSVFLQDTLRVGSALSFVASGRLDYVPYLERVVPSPRGSIIVKPTPRQAVRVSGSTAFRSPTYLESYLDLPIQLAIPGVEVRSSSQRLEDPDFILDPEQIVTADASYLNQTSDLFEFEVTGYYDRVTSLIQLAPIRRLTLSNKGEGLGGFDPETGRFRVGFGGWENRCDVIHVVGGEVGTRIYPVEGLDLFANYAPSWSRQEKPSECAVPEDRRTSRHKVNAGVQVRTPIGLDGEVTYHWQSAQVWAEQVATEDDIEYRLFDLPAYSLLNGRLGFRFLRDQAELSAVVYNVLAGLTDAAPQQHPFGNRVGRRIMGFFTYSLGGRP